MAARHFKYAYNAHIPPKIIFSRMLDVNEVLINGIDFSSQKNKIYFNRRKQLKSLMKSINSYIDFNSQTYFLALYYMDLIFTHKDLEKIFFNHFSLWHQYPLQNVDLQMSNYVLLSLACLIIAAKFNENDSNNPTMSSFLRLLYEFSKKKYIFNLEYLYRAEVVVLKILKYKLNYYTIYHYLIFFFTHGIVLLKTIQRSKIYNKKYSARKILEKIYIKVRELFDEIIESEKYYNYYFGKYNYEIVVEILLWCTEQVLGEKIQDDENIFKLIFGINIEPNKKKEIADILEELSSKIKKRNALSKSTRMIEMSNIKESYNNNRITNQINNFSLLSSRPARYDYNYNINNNYINIQQKSSITKTEALTYRQIYDQYLNQDQKSYVGNNDYFKYINNSNKNEVFNSIDNNNNYQYNDPYQNNQNNYNFYQLNKTTNINYGPNKRVYLTSNKSNITNSIYNINSIEKTQIKNNIDRIKLINNTEQKSHHNSRDIKIIPIQREKEPIDNQKININTNNTGKIILINKNNIETKMKKKSLSCSKNMKEKNFKYIITQRPSVYVSSNSINKKLNFDEPANNTKEIPPDSSKELNNYFFNLKSSEQLKEKKGLEEKPFIKKEIIIPGNKNQTSQYKKYLLTKKSIHNTAKLEQKLIKDNIVNRKKYFDINNSDAKKFNITLELEPQDNYKRKSVNKYYDNSGKTSNNDLNKSYNKANTIIINNNIQINTLINDKSKNLYLLDKDGFKYNYEHKNEKKILSSKTDIKNIRNNANKSNIIF